MLINISATGGTAPFSYLWSDGSDSSSYNQILNPIGQVAVSVTVTDVTGCTVSAGLTTIAVPGTIPPICVAAFDYSTTPDIITTVDTQVIYADSLHF